MKTQDLTGQLRALDEAVQKYSSALETADHCLASLQGDQLMAMNKDLLTCLEKHEAEFASLPLESCVHDGVEFAHDKQIASAITKGISKLGCVASATNDFEGDRDVDEDTTSKNSKRKTKLSSPSPGKNERNSGTSKRNGTPQRSTDKRCGSSAVPRVHFTLAANVGGVGIHQNKMNASFCTPKGDVVVVEVRQGAEEEFLRTGIEGPVMGRVVLETKLEGAKYLKYEAEHLFESLSPRVLLSDAEGSGGSSKTASGGRGTQQPSVSYTPGVRFTKRLRVAGRRGVDWHA